MSPNAPSNKTNNHRAHRAGILFALAILGFVIAAALDGPIARSIYVEDAIGKDWGRALRVLGYWPLWLVVAVVFIIHDGRVTLRPPLRDRFTRGVLLALSSGAAGLAAEACKLIVRRLRPGAADTLWSMRPFTDEPLNTAGLSFPSSHTAIAFGAAFMLCRLHPAAWPLWFALGAGCALQRILANAHYLPDVYAAAILAYICAALLWSMHTAALRRDTRKLQTA